jgi:hypothetical protein
LGKDKGIDYQEEAMTPEHLDLYRQLSETKIYRERFGSWIWGDRYYCSRQAESCSGIKHIQDEVPPEPCCPDVALWLPPVFGPENPERCLWGMVDWKIFDVGGVRSKDNFIFLLDEVRTYYPDCLDIALIRAILKQEEA